jgi:hypothetical protein
MVRAPPVRRRRFSGKKPHGQAKSACCRRRSALRPADRSDFHASAASALARPGRSHEPVRLWCVKPAGPESWPGSRRRSVGVDRIAVRGSGRSKATMPAESRSRRAIRGKSLSPCSV